MAVKQVSCDINKKKSRALKLAPNLKNEGEMNNAIDFWRRPTRQKTGYDTLRTANYVETDISRLDEARGLFFVISFKLQSEHGMQIREQCKEKLDFGILHCWPK